MVFATSREGSCGRPIRADPGAPGRGFRHHGPYGPERTDDIRERARGRALAKPDAGETWSCFPTTGLRSSGCGRSRRREGPGRLLAAPRRGRHARMAERRARRGGGRPVQESDGHHRGRARIDLTRSGGSRTHALHSRRIGRSSAIPAETPPRRLPAEDPPSAVLASDMPAASTAAQPHLDAGLTAFKKRRFSQAEIEFRKAVDAEPGAAAAFYPIHLLQDRRAEAPRQPRKQRAAEPVAKAYARPRLHAGLAHRRAGRGRLFSPTART